MSEDKALKNYETWHDKEPDELLEDEYEFPQSLYKIGKAVQIFYYSDKWEEKNNGHTYYHDFDSRPSVYVSETSKVIPIMGEEKYLTPYSTKKLTGLLNLNGKIMLPILAEMQELTLDFGTHKKRIKWKSESPYMVCSKDRKSLIFLCSDGPIVIRGGKMIATSRGIVN